MYSVDYPAGAPAHVHAPGLCLPARISFFNWIFFVQRWIGTVPCPCLGFRRMCGAIGNSFPEKSSLMLLVHCSNSKYIYTTSTSLGDSHLRDFIGWWRCPQQVIVFSADSLEQRIICKDSKNIGRLQRQGIWLLNDLRYDWRWHKMTQNYW